MKLVATVIKFIIFYSENRKINYIFFTFKPTLYEIEEKYVLITNFLLILK